MSLVINSNGQAVDKTTVKVDDAGTYKYIGEADPGTLTSAARWSICRVTTATGDMLQAAGGNFSQVWDNRASLTYA